MELIASRTNLEWHNIPVTLNMVMKVITNLDSSKVTDPDWFSVMALKNCDQEFRS